MYEEVAGVVYKYYKKGQKGQYNCFFVLYGVHEHVWLCGFCQSESGRNNRK